MNNLLAVLAVILSLNTTPVKAGNHEYKNTPEYVQMEKDSRESLKNCLNDESAKTKDCIEKYKDMHKAKKKEIKKMYKDEHHNR